MILSWGKCKIAVSPVDGTGAISFGTVPTPVENSTSLETTQGDKQEAKTEGGEIVAVRYGSNSYQLVFDCFVDSELAVPAMGKDGIVAGEYSVTITNEENKKAAVVTINRATCNAQIMYSSEEGIKVRYTFSSVKDTTGDTDQVTITKGAGE